jgi:uncharacterized membrane protein
MNRPLFKGSPRHKEGLLYLLTLTLAALFIIIGNRIATQNSILFSQNRDHLLATGKVTDVISRESSTMEWGGVEMESVRIYFRATLTSGRYKGLSVTVTQLNEPIYPIQLREVQPGDRVLVYLLEQEEGMHTWMLQEYDRTGPLLWLGVAFGVLILLFGRFKGFNTLLTLSLTCLSLFLVFVPAILSGFNIYIATYVIAIYVVLMTLGLLSGYNRKSLAAALGCLGGLGATGLLFWLMDSFVRLSGYVDEESVFLLALDTPRPIDLKAIIFAAVVIGALGAVMDVAVSLASSLSEIYDATGGEVSYLRIIKSGLNIGRDIMGATANTLILAYVGSSLSLVLLLVVYAQSPIELFNREMIVVELLQALIGSLGLLITVPITSLAFGYLIHRRHSAAPTEVAPPDGPTEMH